MRTYEFDPQEVEAQNKLSEQDKEQAALQALVNYAIDCAKEANDLVSGEGLEQARRHLSRSVLL
ncbi:hypothetical protein PXK00_15010 [Phaeobacter sp. QD34_3]|uniref:hypothetical protein n=1 Tax=unclassified Phaeobacter TaxID=2621772 RepID=UPI00237F523F|nr:MULTISPECIES: hypothetical protein [unclassified Phaeobacter]MDE4134431.1 hypothetical protein [Phaeobacter sp. QD34_3]MDE4138076.1 hypothetical protein [Phaeobacter sp. QD34_24]MDE4173947.1 hypothetical protein [Phaeobacter sp. PT47_59]